MVEVCRPPLRSSAPMKKGRTGISGVATRGLPPPRVNVSRAPDPKRLPPHSDLLLGEHHVPGRAKPGEIVSLVAHFAGYAWKTAHLVADASVAVCDARQIRAASRARRELWRGGELALAESARGLPRIAD